MKCMPMNLLASIFEEQDEFLSDKQLPSFVMEIELVLLASTQ